MLEPTEREPRPGSHDMKPQDDYRNGDDGGGCGSASGSEDSSGAEGADELSLRDAAAPARALLALNALRKSRQHYDAVLVADGAEVPAHRALLAAASPYLLEAFQAPPPAGPAPASVALRVEGVDAEALRTLVEYAYTGRARVREPAAARRLYRAAWRLRVEPVRAHLARALARRPAPADALLTRALPDLEPHLLRDLDAYIADHFDEICASGALAALPKINIEMLRESSAEGGEETAPAVAAAALTWLRERQAADLDLEELCSRTHLLFVDARGALRDCGELPASSGEAPALGEYRREAAERARGGRVETKAPVAAAAGTALGARVARAGGAAECSVVAARTAGGGCTRALVALRGRLAAARISWRAAGGGITRGGVLGGAREPEGGDRLAALSWARCALGAAALGGRLVACGGYDRARVLRAAEAYDPATNTWAPLPDLRGPRARFPAARLGDALFALGGSDGHADLDSVHALAAGAWTVRARLPLARTHAAAAADDARRRLYVIGGWAGGLSLRRVDCYDPDADAWADAPPLITGRSQCAGVYWAGALWALGGCDAWHCLASTETLSLDAPNAVWTPGPALPTARRSVGGAQWRGRLVSAGGSDGAASLRRTDFLLPGETRSFTAVRLHPVGGAQWRGRLVSAGGSDGAASLRRTDFLLPGADAWSAGPSLRRARAALGLAVLGGALYAVGGFDGKQFLACVETLREPDAEWTTLWAPSAPPAPLAAGASPEEPGEKLY
ncbi:influenza virus NS1A-binding protein homolog A-like [Ostrinia nubilalis]|uniref:influenza virus NS1A-binding protein homolog A-like n=1 Tax=Ostrinia nubilalis TaxID=29057 RepID=UPI003082594E